MNLPGIAMKVRSGWFSEHERGDYPECANSSRAGVFVKVFSCPALSI
jgi:hypothetical protein